jgi:hypothetical protein
VPELDGTTEIVPVELEESTAVKDNIPIEFELSVKEDASITLDFDAAASVQVNETASGSLILRPVVTAPEVTSRVLLERSDPFGGPPAREHGRLWYLPGRGLRYRSDKKNGQDFLIDRTQGTFLLYNPADTVVYRAPFDRAPVRLRRLIVEPERILEKNLRAVPERRVIHGVARDGYRLKSESLGDSLREVSTWIGADPKSGLPRWIAVDSEAESVLVGLVPTYSG